MARGTLKHYNTAPHTNSYKFQQVRAKKFFQIKKGTYEWRCTTYVNPTPMSLLVNLVSSSDGNDIGVGLT